MLGHNHPEAANQPPHVRAGKLALQGPLPAGAEDRLQDKTWRSQQQAAQMGYGQSLTAKSVLPTQHTR